MDDVNEGKCKHGNYGHSCARCADDAEPRRITLAMLVRREVTIECKGATCAPCSHLQVRMAEGGAFPRPGSASCDLFGVLAWPKTVGEIERRPECRKLDGLPAGTEVRVEAPGNWKCECIIEGGGRADGRIMKACPAHLRWGAAERSAAKTEKAR